MVCFIEKLCPVYKHTSVWLIINHYYTIDSLNQINHVVYQLMKLTMTLLFIIIYIRLFGEAIKSCVFNSVSPKLPDEGNIIKNIALLSLFQNGPQRAEIAIPWFYVMFKNKIAWYKW